MFSVFSSFFLSKKILQILEGRGEEKSGKKLLISTVEMGW